MGIGIALVAVACSYTAPPSDVLTSLSVADARDALNAAGAEVQKVDFDKDGFEIAAALSPERHVWFDGMNCRGAGEATTCTEFKISAGWQLDSARRTEAIAKQLNYNYTSVFADGAELNLWRMDFTYGGITRGHLRRTVGEFLILRQQAEETIWPPKGKAQSIPVSPNPAPPTNPGR